MVQKKPSKQYFCLVGGNVLLMTEVRGGMAKLVWVERKATITQISTFNTSGEWKGISECTAPSLSWMGYTSRRPD